MEYQLGEKHYCSVRGVLRQAPIDSSVSAQEIQLEPKASALLNLLLTHAGKTVNKAQILAEVWRERVVGEEVIYVAVNQLRKALGDHPKQAQWIKTISGQGYCYIGPCQPLNANADVSHQAILCAMGAMACTEQAAAITLHQDISLSSSLRYLKRLPVALSLLGILALLLLWLAHPLSFSAPTPMNEALLADFQKARYLLSQPSDDDYSQAKTLLNQVIVQAPDFGPAYLELASAKIAGLYQHDPRIWQQQAEIETLFLKGLSLAPEHHFAQQRLANFYFLVQRDHEKARQHFERSLPSVDGHFFYSQFLLAMGDFTGAMTQLEHYIALYPQGYSKESAAWLFTMSGRYQKGLAELEKLAPYAAEQRYYHVSRQAIYELTGDHDRAFAELTWLMKDAGYDDETLRHVAGRYQAQGLEGVYDWLAFDDTQQLDLGQYQPPLSKARYAIGAGEYDAALTWLEQAEQQHHTALLWLAVDPKYRPLYPQPRFHALLEKLNLSPIQVMPESTSPSEKRAL
ncbi:hypothetical protein VST7929_01066 [Vibrio stylophorae]|uniref:OmpR/PhoB-type domain-containing protein n=1 Tax=Vibrio stylophorae TaxID=659351 RepID=A0ABN8DWS0_9VIBR|nr:winged helix-turn-helix domain-containing protein [Vibrio stylophorae]CAH0533204.1 hypothetical protein VST7929_01066 [Vibrio stylophorae]